MSKVPVKTRLKRAILPLSALGMIGVGIGAWLGWAIACTVIGGLVWLDMSIVSKK